MHAPVNLKQSTINIEALSKLADLLEADAADPKGMEFDLSFWLLPQTCKSAGCAIGLAMTNQWFKERGFTSAYQEPYYESPNGKGYIHWQAVEQFFGISHGQAVYLFSAGNYSKIMGPPAELEVAARLREFVANPF